MLSIMAAILTWFIFRVVNYCSYPRYALETGHRIFMYRALILLVILGREGEKKREK